MARLLRSGGGRKRMGKGWLLVPLAIVLGAQLLQPLVGRHHPAPQGQALALLVAATAALSGYLFHVMAHPERY